MASQAVVLCTLVLSVLAYGSPDAGVLKVEHSQSSTVVPRYEVFELTFQHDGTYEDPFFDVSLDVTFVSPSSKQVRIGGFHYKQDLWKARFAPSELGRWTYRFVFRNAKGQAASGEGDFTCIKGRMPNPGFVRRNPEDPDRFVFDDGTPYFPIGVQDCWGDGNHNGSVLDEFSMEGPFRTDLKDPPALPAGPMFVRGPSSNPQNADVFFRYFGRCGFNLYRFSQKNCSYELYRDLESDRVTASRAQQWKRAGKPVIVGEQGNHIDKSKPVPPGVGGVWDDRSALRMRIRNWTALFNEIAVVFWNTSYARDGHYMNIWLGPKEREYVRSMQDFAYRLDKDVRMHAVSGSRPEAVQAYALASGHKAGVYLHHFKDHTGRIEDLRIELDLPGGAKGYWYNPEDASIAKIVEIAPGLNRLDVPPFAVDLALLVTPDGAPDIDHDGRPNHEDADDDQDGVPDDRDTFPDLQEQPIMD